ncbi:protein bfr2-like [Magnolia sinica]|uniref:protein bfr2-like n=1 Tax=Magnolia sinica TaxID=86752 RepID=UPI002658A446|nr:protein bfr2-like [Magnolia sinica]
MRFTLWFEFEEVLEFFELSFLDVPRGDDGEGDWEDSEDDEDEEDEEDDDKDEKSEGPHDGEKDYAKDSEDDMIDERVHIMDILEEYEFNGDNQSGRDALFNEFLIHRNIDREEFLQWLTERGNEKSIWWRKFLWLRDDDCERFLETVLPKDLWEFGDTYEGSFSGTLYLDIIFYREYLRILVIEVGDNDEKWEEDASSEDDDDEWEEDTFSEDDDEDHSYFTGFEEVLEFLELSFPDVTRVEVFTPQEEEEERLTNAEEYYEVGGGDDNEGDGGGNDDEDGGGYDSDGDEEDEEYSGGDDGEGDWEDGEDDKDEDEDDKDEKRFEEVLEFLELSFPDVARVKEEKEKERLINAEEYYEVGGGDDNEGDGGENDDEDGGEDDSDGGEEDE